jgi:hypothetical protein
MRARRLAEPIGSLRPHGLRPGRPGEYHLVGGRVVAPPGGPLVTFEDELDEPGVDLTAPHPREVVPEVVIARADIEEQVPYARPRLFRFERGRDFLLVDDSGSARVRLGEATFGTPHLHPDVELHLESPFVAHDLPLKDAADSDEPPAVARTAYVRVVRPGDRVYVFGRVAFEPDPEAAGYRDAPLVPSFSATASPLDLYDAPAFALICAWERLPWYRKLSVLVRNR